jgi:hypothetical protein
VKAGDIPNTTPSITLYNINFPVIISEDICKAVLETENTIPGIDKILITIL